ncbi:MAG: hypothetical protein HC902_14360 [Calothrix sp. SM1_5_4]|nr:hypothetical protein [Calothrix sp. SM1_5_4]
MNLLRDLIVCQYHMNDMLGFRSNLNRLELLLLEKEPLLSPRSLVECELMLGKLLEEEARLAPALLYYERALSRSFKAEHRARALIQKARWKALYEPSAELSGLYRELISLPTERMTQDLHVELEHSLMLIELRLIGCDHAWSRIERLKPCLCDMDHRLLVFDYVEGALVQEFSLSPAVLASLDEFDVLDPYEEFLRRMVQESLEHTEKIRVLTALAPKLPWASYLRLLCVTANLESHASAKEELNRKIQLIIRGLDSRSQELWSQRLKQALQAPEVRIDLSMRRRSISVAGKKVDLSKKKIALQLLGGLLGKSCLSVDEAINLLWQSSFTPEHYHRLRMSAHRLNTLIHEITGLAKSSRSIRKMFVCAPK